MSSTSTGSSRLCPAQAAADFRRWFGANVDIEHQVGGRFAMGGFELDPGGATFVEFEPGHKARVRYADGMLDSWELEGSNGKTRLTLVLSGFDPANPPYAGGQHDPGAAQPDPVPRGPGALHQPLGLFRLQLAYEHLGADEPRAITSTRQPARRHHLPNRTDYLANLLCRSTSSEPR